jgi:hypothetical protein
MKNPISKNQTILLSSFLLLLGSLHADTVNYYRVKRHVSVTANHCLVFFDNGNPQQNRQVYGELHNQGSDSDQVELKWEGTGTVIPHGDKGEFLRASLNGMAITAVLEKDGDPFTWNLTDAHRIAMRTMDFISKLVFSDEDTGDKNFRLWLHNMTTQTYLVKLDENGWKAYLGFADFRMNSANNWKQKNPDQLDKSLYPLENEVAVFNNSNTDHTETVGFDTISVRSDNRDDSINAEPDLASWNSMSPETYYILFRKMKPVKEDEEQERMLMGIKGFLNDLRNTYGQILDKAFLKLAKQDDDFAFGNKANHGSMGHDLRIIK